MELSVVGGLGHIGLPLSLQLARVGHDVQIIDPDEEKQKLFEQNKAAFVENGIEDAIERYEDKIDVYTDGITKDNVVIVTTNNENVLSMIESYYEASEKIWLIRQTVKPGTIREIYDNGYNVAYIPERLAQGKALSEIMKIPQIVGIKNSYFIDKKISEIIHEIFNWIDLRFLSFEEAELAKLFCNYYRYGTFALANDMYLISQKLNANFNKIRDVIRFKYPRMNDFPKAGFAGGFCLPKDTKHLAEYSNYALETDKINMESFIQKIVTKMQSYANNGDKVGILGLTAKPENDDIRSSVKTKMMPLIKAFDFDVKTHDPFIESDSIEEVMECDVIAIMIPHKLYYYFDYFGKELIDPWGVAKNERS